MPRWLIRLAFLVVIVSLPVMIVVRAHYHKDAWPYMYGPSFNSVPPADGVVTTRSSVVTATDAAGRIHQVDEAKLIDAPGVPEEKRTAALRLTLGEPHRLRSDEGRQWLRQSLLRLGIAHPVSVTVTTTEIERRPHHRDRFLRKLGDVTVSLGEGS
jgi:hypothetical protein